MNKVIRFELIPEENVKETYKEMWKIQQSCAKIANRTVQYAWEWFNYESDYFKKNGEYIPKEKTNDILGKNSLSTFVYEKCSEEFSFLSSRIIGSISRDISGKFNKNKKDYLLGKQSIMTFKDSFPIPIAKQLIKIENSITYKDNKRVDNQYILSVVLFSRKYAKERNNNSSIRFKMIVKDNSQKSFLQNCNQLTQYIIDDNQKSICSTNDALTKTHFQITGSTISYNERKRKWFINLGYTFEAKKHSLNENTIVGVHLGYKSPIYCSLNNSKEFLRIDSNEVTSFRNKIYARRKALQKQTKYCGEGRIGHGIKTRTNSFDETNEKIKNFRDTCNHKYSRAIVDFALKNKASTIILKDLTGIAEQNLFLKSWSYYDLQNKISNKAAEYGIETVFVKSEYTSRRCSKCGHINTEKTEVTDFFVCEECKEKIDYDRNSALNLVEKDIENVIKKQVELQKL